MFLLGWLIDIIFTIGIVLAMVLFLGNSPIVFLTMIIFPVVFILAWTKIFKKRGC